MNVYPPLFAQASSKLGEYCLWEVSNVKMRAHDRQSKLSIQLPAFYIIHGNYPGPTVMITAGVHGTEIAGMLTAKELLNLQITNGTLVIIPIVNETAYKQRKRGNPDVNRTFPRDKNDKPKHPIAGHILQIAKRFRASWCIDLHEANGFYQLDHTKLGQTLIVYPNEKTYRIAKRVAKKVNRTIHKNIKKFSVHQGTLPGSLRTAMGAILSCHALTVETSMQQPRHLRVQYQQQIVELLLREIGLIEKEISL
jgi:uncharacterized protein